MIIEIVIIKKKDKGKIFSIKQKAIRFFADKLEEEYHKLFTHALKITMSKPEEDIDK